MHAKYVLALILALQVSVSLCDDPQPSQELIVKYNDMKTTFFRRVMALLTRLWEIIQPHLQPETRQAVMERFDALSKHPRYQALKGGIIAAWEELAPLVDQIRMHLLAEYERKLRPSFGVPLSTAIDSIKLYLDVLMPVE